MKRAWLAAILGAVLISPATAADWTLGALTVSDPFARATAGRATAGGGFLTITNSGEEDRLIAAHSDVAGKTELHTHIMDGDVMKMRQVEAIDVPEKGKVEMKPGGFHVMFMQLKEPLKEGEVFPLELTFEKAGSVTIDMKVGSVGAKMPMKHD